MSQTEEIEDTSAPLIEHLAELRTRFCGLKGATESPRRAAARHKPATNIDLPTLEPVP